MSPQYISTGSEWTFELLEEYDAHISRLAKGFGLTTFPNQIEIISAEQMMDAYSSVGMPIGYHHWSYGKKFMSTSKNYKRGHMGLAYEIVINSNPCIAYLMEENSIAMQALVIAHACYGHNSFFKNNYLFKTWTSPDSIIDYLVFAKNYITDCERRYGVDAVESLLDACHALMNYGVDRYKHPGALSIQEEKVRQQNREQYLQSQVNDLWRTIPKTEIEDNAKKKDRFPPEPQENILYFLEKNAPLLKPWQREIIRITRKIAQYFYPQRQTQVMNEGWACFWHHTLLNALYDEKLVTDEFMMEILQSHTNVVFQPSFDNPYYSGINPYSLGYNMMQDIRRICENPSDEDKRWFPDLANTDWNTSLHFAMENFKDESFVAQYLSPKLIREMKLFSILNKEQANDIKISAIHDDAGYQAIRESLSKQYNLSFQEPNIQVFDVDVHGDRALTLQHIMNDNRPLNKDAEEVLKYLHQLWGFPVQLVSMDQQNKIVSKLSCPPSPSRPL